MRRFRDLMGAHKRFAFGLWILVLVGLVGGVQWQLTGHDSVLTQVLGASQSTAPQPLIVSGPSGTMASTSATFTYSDTQSGVAFACELDGAAYASCTSPAVYEGLAAGSHTFSVQAVNGPATSPAASFTWTVTAASFGISGTLTASLAPGLWAPL